jgi:hypothetical protein
MKTKPTTRRPTPRQLCAMYCEAFAHEGERITDAAEYVERLAAWLCETGLLKRKGNRRVASPFGEVLLGRHNYLLARSSTEADRLALDSLHELDRRVTLLAGYVAAGEAHKASVEAIEAGRLIERVLVLAFDGLVGKGRRRVEIEVAMRREAANARRITPEKRQAIIVMLKGKRSLQAIVNKLKPCSKKTVAKVKREAIATGELTT